MPEGDTVGDGITFEGRMRSHRCEVRKYIVVRSRCFDERRQALSFTISLVIMDNLSPAIPYHTKESDWAYLLAQPDKSRMSKNSIYACV
jgi:hypothetical protein